MTNAELDALCERLGIAVGYRDIWGGEHAAPESTKRALLVAMGALDRDGAIVASATRVTPAAIVWQAGDPAPALHARPHEGVDASRLRWTLELEAGGRLDGPCEPADDDAQVRCAAWPDALPLGYHRLAVEGFAPASARPPTTLIACPARCVSPADRGVPGRVFGPAIQLYALRSRRNWGIGDFSDLAALARFAARHGASFVGLNPLHELFLDRPEAASPYSPSTRLALNPLYLDVEAVDGFTDCDRAREAVAAPGFQSRLAALRAAPLVDYAGVAAAKLEVLGLVFADFRARHLDRDDALGKAFRSFTDSHASMALHPALFDAVQAAMRARDAATWGWPAWPQALRDRRSAAVEALARERSDAVDFHAWLQWQADRQLAAAERAARDAGMAIGLYRDLAVGANPGGAETWSAPERFALGVHVGAPPDEFNQKGQDWGLPPWIPAGLATSGFTSWIDLLRANMRHAGALRIDHVMALLRLFWIPEGASPADGTYVHYPIGALLAILALESVRNGCIVVGEDLGTVPDDVRTALRARGVHAYRVVYFERTGNGDFALPDAYPGQALVTISTHDLPTLHGFWQSTDLAARDRLDLFPDALMRQRQHADRAADRMRLVRALAQTGLSPLTDPVPEALDFAQVLALHAYAARTPCAMMTVQLEDVFGETEQVNLPATMDHHYPNWRRKIAVDLEDWEQDARFAAVCAAIRAQGRGAGAEHGAGAADAARLAQVPR